LRSAVAKTIIGSVENDMHQPPDPEPLDAPDKRRPLDDLFCATYEELRRLATQVKRGDRQVTLTPTALVNEAWLKLAGSTHLASVPRLHFKRIAARAMRQVLIEAARRRCAAKRGGRHDTPDVVTLDESLDVAIDSGRGLIALDAALKDLARVHPRQAQIVEARFFGGFSVDEISELLDLSEATILRDWRVAKAWLSRELRRGA
jgi:RNA polymerase sigma factor (TIGR02999 family)